MNPAIFLVLLFGFLIQNVKADSNENCDRPTVAELVGKTFIPFGGCVAGLSYATTGLVGRCSCWHQGERQCGYICNNSGQLISPASRDRVRIRRQAPACPPTPLPPNTQWKPSPRCLAGNDYTTLSQSCTCCGMLGYLCSSKTPPLPPCPANPLPRNVISYIPDQGCTLLQGSATDILITADGQTACACTRPVQCGVYCYDIRQVILGQ